MKPFPHEGGFYVETYRASEMLPSKFLSDRYVGPRNLSTAILYLLTPHAFSALHRVKTDEIFHFYLGDTVTMLQLKTDGSSVVITLGQDVTKGQHVQYVIPSDTWQGMVLKEGGKFALLGTTMAPGFESEDFELAQREKLLAQYPTRRQLIIRLTKSK